MEQYKEYLGIDMVRTGFNLKWYIKKSGMSVKEIQEYLHLSCPQPIYRWIKGTILPSVDHLLMLSELFGVHMEELLVKKRTTDMLEKSAGVEGFEGRIKIYYNLYTNRVA